MFYCAFSIKSRLSHGYFPNSTTGISWELSPVMHHPRITKQTSRALCPSVIYPPPLPEQNSFLRIQKEGTFILVKHKIKHKKGRYPLFILASGNPRPSSEGSSHVVI